jgi:hypothetical protein
VHGEFVAAFKPPGNIKVPRKPGTEDREGPFALISAGQMPFSHNNAAAKKKEEYA